MKRVLIVLALLVIAFGLSVSTALAAWAPPIVIPALTPESLGMIAGALLALVMAYVPVVNDWYSSLSKQAKAGVMILLLVIVSAVLFAGSCGGVVSAGLTCDKEGAVSLLSILIACITANQGTFVLAVRPFQKE